MARKNRSDAMDDADLILTQSEPEKKLVTQKPVRRTIAAEYRLTDAELLKFGDELSAAHEELEHLEEQKKNLQDQKKNEIAAVDARVNELVRKIRSKVETREFFCEAELDFELKIKRWKDVKTGEIRKTEELSAHDYQMKLRLEEGVDNESNDDNDDDGIWPEKEEILDETDGVVADETVSDPV